MVTDSWVDSVFAALNYLKAKYGSINLNGVATQIATRFVTSADKYNKRNTERTFGIDITDDQSVRDTINASIKSNVALIKSIPQQYLDQVESIVSANVQSGARYSYIAEQLLERFEVTKSRAQLIARDQTGKVNGYLNQKRQVSSGFEYFEWDDVDDERERAEHREFANRVTKYGKGIYRWDNPPHNKKGQPLICGQDYQCRCVGRPVSQFEVDQNIKAGRVNPSVSR